MYILAADHPNRDPKCRSLQCFNVHKCVNTRTVHFLVNCYRLVIINQLRQYGMPIAVAVRSKEWVCGRSLTRIVGSNPPGGMNVCVVFVVRTVIWNVK
jgi:hypothetical protein